MVNPTHQLFRFIQKIQKQCKVFIETNRLKQEFLDFVVQCEETKSEWTVILDEANNDRQDVLVECMIEFIDSIYNFCARAYSKKVTNQNLATRKLKRETRSQRKQLRNIVNSHTKTSEM